MALEDLAMFRSIPQMIVLYPSDAVSTEKAVEIAANYEHAAYIRTSRPETQVIYKNDEHFEIGNNFK
jgi:transketolase